MYLFQLASFLRIRGRKRSRGRSLPLDQEAMKDSHFFKHKFFNPVLSGISNRRKGRRSIMRASGREDITEERVVLLCNIDMPTISYFPPCYVDQRGGIIGRIDRWFSAKLISFPRSIEWIENIFAVFILIRMEQRIGKSLWQEFSIHILSLDISIKKEKLHYRFDSQRNKDSLRSFDYLKRLSPSKLIQRNCSSLQRLSRLPCKLAG